MWSLTLDKAALAVHLAIRKLFDTYFCAVLNYCTFFVVPGYDALMIMQKASRLMRFKYSLTYTTIQVEPWDEPTMSTCFQCVGPQS